MFNNKNPIKMGEFILILLVMIFIVCGVLCIYSDFKNNYISN